MKVTASSQRQSTIIPESLSFMKIHEWGGDKLEVMAPRFDKQKMLVALHNSRIKEHLAFAQEKSFFSSSKQEVELNRYGSIYEVTFRESGKRTAVTSNFLQLLNHSFHGIELDDLQTLRDKSVAQYQARVALSPSIFRLICLKDVTDIANICKAQRLDISSKVQQNIADGLKKEPSLEGFFKNFFKYCPKTPLHNIVSLLIEMGQPEQAFLWGAELKVGAKSLEVDDNGIMRFENHDGV